MPLATGDRLGAYEIVSLLGKGGMGEVWKARDPRLNRDVAIKVSDARFSERFAREAKAIAALNHPNICQIYDVGPNYLVMEYIEGTPPKGPVAPAEAVRLALGIAAALEAAHGKGITHRDLKPANVLVTKSDIKLLDFGLALVNKNAEAGIHDDTSTTLTAAGAVIGTIAYMSPEQAAGKPLDVRSDIFSFGVVLYELLAGCRPFNGSTNLEVLQKVIHGSVSPLDERVPVGLRMLVEKALDKDPEDRYQTMREVVVDLRRVARQPGTGVKPVASAASERPRRGPLVWVTLAGLSMALGLLAGRWFWFRPDPIPKDVRFQRITDFVGVEESPAVSPDGKTVAFVAPAGGRQQIGFGCWPAAYRCKSLTMISIICSPVGRRTPVL
jgi:serine/threonine protein kinase